MFLSEDHFRDDFFDLKLENDLFIGRYLCSHVTLDIVKTIYEARIKIAKGRRCRAFLDATLVKKVDKEAREFLAGKDNPDELIAGAIVIKSNVQKTMGNLYIYFNKLPIPTRIFTNEKTALRWLRKVKK
jgi:hypothetical protein